jgi:hypothetical protein
MRAIGVCEAIGGVNLFLVKANKKTANRAVVIQGNKV